MLKSLHKDDTQLTPFVVTKDWELSNVANEDLILMEHSGSDGPPVALEYIDYTTDEPIPASDCDIALEQQGKDLVGYKDGLKVKGNFYPETDPQNPDGTYQRSVYAQVATMFYNNYRDPSKMWGWEKIDFELSKTKKFITDKFKLFEIPQEVFGEKVGEYTVTMYDNTTDNDYIITDDGNCNLFAGNNVFSRQQELGHYSNLFTSGSNHACDGYNTIDVPLPPSFSYVVCSTCIPPEAFISWHPAIAPINVPATYYVLEKSIDGINYNVSWSFGSGIYNYIDTNITFSNQYWYRLYAGNFIGTSSFSITSSVYSYTGSGIWDTDPDFWDSPCNPIYWAPSGSVILNWEDFNFVDWDVWSLLWGDV